MLVLVAAPLLLLLLLFVDRFRLGMVRRNSMVVVVDCLNIYRHVFAPEEAAMAIKCR